MTYYSISSAGLIHVISLESDNDFTFEIGGSLFKCNHIIAEFISPLISKLRSNDSSVNYYHIVSSDIPEAFKPIYEIMTNGETKIWEDPNFSESAKIAIELENEELVKILIPNEPSNIKNIVNLIQIYLNNKIDASKEIKYAAENFNNIDKMLLAKCDPEIVNSIISSEFLSLENETILLKFIIKCIEVNGDSAVFLLSNVKVDHLPPESIPLLTSTVERLGCIKYVWKSICDRLSLPVRPSTKGHKVGSFKGTLYKFDGQLFKGIISGLSEKLQKGPEKCIKLRSSGELSSTTPVSSILNDDYTMWISSPGNGQRVSFDFEPRRVLICGYTIGLEHVAYPPKSWVIEGSEDGKEWTVIDEQKNTKGNVSFYRDLGQHSMPFRIIQLRSTHDEKNPNANFISIARIEFFGTVQE